MQERRRFIRVPDNSQISYEVISRPKIGDFFTKDISQGGIRFFVHEFIPKNALLKIRLTLKKLSFSFEAVVKLVWIREDPHSDRHEIGVEFINLPKKATEYLIDYIRNILSIRSH